MQITTLIENTRSESKDLLAAEHGLSLYISFNKATILFDMGSSDSFAKNAETLGADLSTVNAAVLSHHHYDHGGGLPRFFELNARAPVYLKKPPDGDCYFKAFLCRKRYIGLDRDLFKMQPARFAFLEEFTEILPDVYIFTHIRRAYPKPKGNRHLYIKKDACWSLDNFAHELIMAIEENGELVIFTGCSHNGLLNMIDTVTKKFQGMPVKAVIGGFHLIGLPGHNTMAGSKGEIQDIAGEVLSYPVKSLCTGHCTGQKAYTVLKRVLGEKLQHLHTGTVLQL
jgi:7,8-dihydropterin-6-yl-methyl-4-(beta-D-ribofuranosyl)aminobenzene 5'-phosphate synthase